MHLLQRRDTQSLIALAALAAVAGVVRAQTAVPTTDVPALKAALYDPAARAEQREQAAQRLLTRPDPAARTTLTVALSEFGQPAVQLAAAKALAARPTPDATLINPLFALFDASSAEPLIDAAASALSAYKDNPDVLGRLLGLTASADERIRLAAIRSSGRFVDKRVAETLVPLVDPVQPRVVGTAAAQALSYLSGLDPSTDAAGWQAWWAANRGKTDAAFQGDLARARSPRFDQAQRRAGDLEDEMGRILADVYAKAPREQRTDLLLRYLRSGEATARAIGCRLAREDAEKGATPRAVIEQLRALIGDASPDVRRRAASALALINDADSVGPLLTQLFQETDTTVRAALADALRPTQDPRAVPALLTLLDDPSPETAQTVAEALAVIGERLRETDPAAADAAAEKIASVLAARTTAQNNVALRNALVQALAPLRSASRQVRQVTLQRMLVSPAEDRTVRRSVLDAVGRYRSPNLADDIAVYIDPKYDETTRLAALRALGQSADSFGSFERRLSDLIDPKESQLVRDGAWKVLTGLFTKAPTDQLGTWELRLKNDPVKLIVLLNEQRNRATLANKPEEVAYKSRQIGDAARGAMLWGDAITAYLAAITYANATGQNTEVVGEGLADAYFKSGQFGPGISFVQQQIAKSKSYEGSLGPVIVKEAERLVDIKKDYNAADQLIDAALKMQPPLSPRYLDSLQMLRAQVKNRTNKQIQTPFPSQEQTQTALAW